MITLVAAIVTTALAVVVFDIRVVRRRKCCTWTFASGHPLLSICPNCGRSGGEHPPAPPGAATLPGVDWLGRS